MVRVAPRATQGLFLIKGIITNVSVQRKYWFGMELIRLSITLAPNTVVSYFQARWSLNYQSTGKHRPFPAVRIQAGTGSILSAFLLPSFTPYLYCTHIRS
jgi:hypothetical protein